MGKHKVTEIRHLTDSTYVVRMERNGVKFESGQFVIINRLNSIEQREYSVYSGENDDYLEVLVREVVDGKVSPHLKQFNGHRVVELDGPYGFFKFQPEQFKLKKFLFVASGTGISPFHSIVRTYPELDYKLVHGVRYGNEAYGHDDFEKRKIVLCTSGDHTGNFYGRVTEYLVSENIEPATNCFLCGNSDMIYEVFDILTAKGIQVSDIHSEVYF